jgi:hypothetical protein
MHEPIFLCETTRHSTTAGEVELPHAFFAAEVPYLTHFLTAYDEAGGPALRDALVEDVLARQVGFIHSLHLGAESRFAVELRFVFAPERRRIRIYLVGKTSGDDEDGASRQARQLWRHVDASFPHQLYPLRPISGGDEARRELQTLLELPGPGGTIAELRRHERHEHLEMGQSGYVVYPLQGASEGLHRLFHILVRQELPCVVAVALQPTELLAEERDLLGVIASACREQARRTEQLVTSSVEMVSIQAGDVADLYTQYLRRLQSPFLFRLSVAAGGELDSGLLSALLADCAHPFEVDERLVPNRAGDFVIPGDPSQVQVARFNLRYIEFYDWTPRLAEPKHSELQRLRQLADAEGAASLFRLPIPPIGGLPGIDSRPPSLFEPLPEKMLFPSGQNPVLRLGPVHLDLRQLTQHALIAGTIGSGKTNTAVQLLYKLWTEHRVPFLVIEPVNAEHDDYRSLGRYFSVPDELRIFTLGDESTSPLRWNPFEVPGGVILNTHISGLMACFLAALPMGDGPLPSLFREAMRNVYFAKGWQAEQRGDNKRDVPNLQDLRDELTWLIAERYGERGEVAQTLIGASVTRVNALINSSAGQILMAERSLPTAELFEKPTILELRHLGSEEDKALMTGFLLLALQEYCDRNRPVGSGQLHHVVLLEEAHNLMEEPKSGAGDDAKAAAVRFFTNMLAENRKYGQGFIIVEQIPTLLAQGALKNSIVKVMHRLPGPDDIEVMGATMNFKERHKTRAVALTPHEGEAFFYADGLNEATLINIDYFKKDEPLKDSEVQEAMSGLHREYPKVWAEKMPFEGCRFCDAPCEYRPRAARLGYDRSLGQRVLKALRQVDPKDRDQTVHKVTAPIRRAAGELGFANRALVGASYCGFLHLRDQFKKLEIFRNLKDFHARMEADAKHQGGQ